MRVRSITVRGRPAQVGVGLLAALAALVAVALGERVLFLGAVLPGVEIAGASVAGRDEDEALRELERVAEDLERRPIRARGGGRELLFLPTEIGYDVNARATVRSAREAGRSRNPLDQVGGTVLRRFRSDRVGLAVSWDPARLDAVLDRWDLELARGLRSGSLEFDGADVVVTEPRSGVGLVRLEAERRVEDALRSGNGRVVPLPVGDTDPPVGREEVERAAARARRILSASFTLTVEGTVITVTPEQVGAALTAEARGRRLELGVDTDRLRYVLAAALAPFEVAPADATWQVDGVTATVVPAFPGRRVDLAPLADAILAERREVSGPLMDMAPDLTTEEAQALGITEKVSEFTTSFTAGQPRVANIHRAADLANNAIVRPGETFSLNDRLGPRDCALGWVEAPAFATEAGFYQECGGGVSQFSTTLFNATFFGGYEDVEHTPHSIYISRYPMGREATLDFGSIDNRFRNDSRSGVLIRTSYTAASVTVAFYGNLEGRSVRAEGPNVVEEIPVAVEYVDNPFLPAGQEMPVPGETGYTGYKVENFRVITRPGEPELRERFYWEYDMRPRKIWRGVGPPA